jgi:hypothetical protein
VSSKKKKRPAGSSYRAPTTSAAPARRGLLDSVFAPRTPGSSAMPKLRSTIARGAIATVSIAPVVLTIPVVVLGVWLVLLAGDFEGPFKSVAFVYAIPPVSSLVDASILPFAFRPPVDATGTAAAVPTLLGFFGGIAVHSLLSALVATTVVERLRTGSVTMWSVRRAARVFRVTGVVAVIALGMFMVGQIALAILGQIGVLVFIGVLVMGVYVLGFAPAIAADEDRSLAGTLTRSVRAARVPGSANLWVAILYVFICAAAVVLPLPGSTIGVTPSIGGWVFVIVAGLFHVLVQTTLAYRYLVVAPDVPEQPTPRVSSAGRR